MDLLRTVKTPRTLVLLLLLSALFTLCAASSRRQRLSQCRRIPGFRVNDVEPMALVRGHVTLVALLTSNCPFCIRQSRSLEAMHTAFQANGTDVRMMIVNGGPRPSPGETGVFENIVSFPVYHDDNSRTIWRWVFRGGKDDILVTDRCGQLTFRVPFPYSYLQYSYVTRALNRTLTSNVCNCDPNSQASQNLNDRMMGDAPALGGRASSRRGLRAFRGYRNINRSRCRRNDLLCRELRRGTRRYNRFMRAHPKYNGMTEEELIRHWSRSFPGLDLQGPRPVRF
ncbi:selenoprotein Pb-like [Babylonia areolata]|uniref:selenoprotein Pb-like n=1 Tax=Babylonia areolata TaxID=304850 RepID=UPI003FD22150